MARRRFHIVVRETINGRRSTFNYTREPVRESRTNDLLTEAVQDQYRHLSESGVPVRGITCNHAVLMFVHDGEFKRGVSITVRGA